MTYVATIVDQMPGIEKHRKSFLKVLVAAFCTFVGKATAANLARFGISEKRIRRWFHKPFDWQSLHIAALKHAGVLENKLLACIDATFISKAGKHTDDIGSFYNAKVGRSDRGCEAIHLGILDACEHTAYTLACEHTRVDAEDTRTKPLLYLDFLSKHAPLLEQQGITHLVADGYFTKKTFLPGALELGLSVIGKLRKDASIFKLYQGKQKGRGRPKKYDIKLDFQNPRRGMKYRRCRAEGLDLYWQDARSKHLGVDMRVVVVRQWGKEKNLGILYSTDLSLDALEIVRMYRLRFQQEFIFRDGKQHFGLGDCQMRKRVARNEHLEASLCALNLQRLEDRELWDGKDARVISMGKWKRLRASEYVVERFLIDSACDPSDEKFKHAFDNLRNSLLHAA